MKKTTLGFACLFLLFSAVPVLHADTLVTYEKLQSLYTQRDFKDLEMSCQANLRVAPKNEDSYQEALFFLIAERIYGGDFKAAVPYIKLFRDAQTAREAELTKKNGAPYLLIDARFVSLYYEIGKYYFETENWAETVRWLTMAKASESAVKDPMLFFRLGTACQETRDYENARKYYSKELELDGKEPSPYYNIACTYALQKDKGRALEWLKKAVAAHAEFGPQALKDPDFVSLSNDPNFKKIASEP